MKKLLFFSMLSGLLFTLEARHGCSGGGFGSCFGGSLFGSFLGTSFSNALTQPCQRETIVYQSAPQPTHVIVREEPHYSTQSGNEYHRVKNKQRELEERIEELERENKRLRKRAQDYSGE